MGHGGICYSHLCFLLCLSPKVLISLSSNNFKDTHQKTNKTYLEQKILLWQNQIQDS